MALILEQLLQNVVKFLELKLKVCTSVTYLLLDLKSSVVVYKGKTTKMVSVQQIMELITEQLYKIIANYGNTSKAKQIQSI